ncbi:hypothetical protein FB451DRAFT_1177061 [Mycena latifolia]|nr:hypothetical protein FB451DRAFT_1177061 [Mycena latifolia]
MVRLDKNRKVKSNFKTCHCKPTCGKLIAERTRRDHYRKVPRESIRPSVSPDPIDMPDDVVLPFSHSSSDFIYDDVDPPSLNLEVPADLDLGWDFQASDSDDADSNEHDAMEIDVASDNSSSNSSDSPFPPPVDSDPWSGFDEFQDLGMKKNMSGKQSVDAPAAKPKKKRKDPQVSSDTPPIKAKKRKNKEAPADKPARKKHKSVDDSETNPDELDYAMDLDSDAHSPSKNKNEPLRDLVWADLPSKCPTFMCLEELPKTPNTRLLSLFNRRQLLVQEVGRSGPGVHFLEFEICAAIGQEKSKDTYGPKGEFVINSTIIRLLSAREEDLGIKLFSTLHNKVIVDDADDLDDYDETSELIPLKDFIAFILTPLTAALLIAEDRSIDLEEAIDVRDASSNFDNPFFSAPPRHRKPALNDMKDGESKGNDESKPQQKPRPKPKPKPKNTLSLDDFIEKVKDDAVKTEEQDATGYGTRSRTKAARSKS